MGNVLEDLDSGAEIARATSALLAKAEANGRLPTPMLDIVAAADLTLPAQSLLAADAIEQAPAHLKAKLKKFSSKILALVDRRAREVHVNPEISHDGQKRFRQAHEVTHDILLWHKDLAYADDNRTLSWATHIRMEQEANQGGAELLFQRGLFAEMADDYRIGFSTVVDLANKFGASYHASFRRYVETHRKPLAGVVLEISPSQQNPVAYRRREVVCSMSWAKQFDHPKDWPELVVAEPYSFVAEIPRLGGLQPPVCDWSYLNLNNEPTVLRAELFSNSYRVFVLIWPPSREVFKPRRRLILPASATR